MSKLKFILCIICACFVTTSMAQGIKSIGGTVSDSFDALMGATVQEIDGTNRIVSAAVTDMNGNFVLKIQNPKNKIKISYVGCKTQILPINKSVYKIILEDAMVLKDVVIQSKKKMHTSGLSIPEREVSFAAQTISAKEFEGLGLTSVDEALQGRIAGLDIVANSGNLGSGTSMRLRGASTISTVCSSEPLIVVNGNVWNVDQEDFDVSTATDEKFAQLLNINPEDIEDIKVMKDAAATAIWGSQGANGVIEIKTKRGSRGKPKLTYSTRMTGTYQPTGIKMLNGDQYTMLLKESYFNPHQSDAAANIIELNYDPTFSEYQMFNNNTDWVKEVTQMGLRQNHYISVSGGDEKATFRISGGYDRETGSIIAQSLDRFSTRVALDYYVSDRIKIISNFALTYTDNNRNSDNLLGISYKKMPNLAIYEEDVNGNSLGNYYHMLRAATDNDQLKDQRGLVNPIASAYTAINKYRTYDITPELELQYDLLGVDDSKTRLTYNGRVVMNIFNAYTDTNYPRELSTGTWDSGVNRSTSASSKSLAFTTTHTLTLTPHFNNEDHSFLAMARFQLVSGSSSGQNTDAVGLPNGVEAPSAGGVITGMGSSFNQWRSLYYTLSAHYAYKSKYMLDYSMRMDATTKFGPNKRWGYFPALSGRWNIIDEPWMKDTHSWLSMLSVRPGWGMVGNQPGQNYLYINKYISAGRYLDMTGMRPANLKLTNLRWETKYTWNVGFDLGFFDNKITMDINLYTQTTKDMLMGNAAIPTSSGYPSLAYKNVGNMKNNGWELNINGNNLLKRGKFSMNFNLVFANNHNVITKMDPTILATLNNDFSESNRSVLQRVQLNNAFGSIYGFRYKGVYNYSYKNWEEAEAKGMTSPVARNTTGSIILDDEGEPLQMRFCYGSVNYKFKGGDAIYEDINHDGNINQLDIVYLGNSLPKLTGGFGFRFNYDRWSLNAQFNYRIDYDILNLARLDMESMISNNNQSQAVNYRWRKEGDMTSIPRAMLGGTSNYNTLVSDRFVEDGTFLRLNYLQLSYSLPMNTLKRIGLTQLSFYASANNLFCLTKYSGVDPEIGYGGYGVSTDNSQTPRSKSYTIGVTIGF